MAWLPATGHARDQSFGNQQAAVAASDLAARASCLPSDTPSTRLELADATFEGLVKGEDWLYPMPLA